jgi:hypothetical protein
MVIRLNIACWMKKTRNAWRQRAREKAQLSKLATPCLAMPRQASPDQTMARRDAPDQAVPYPASLSKVVTFKYTFLHRGS